MDYKRVRGSGLAGLAFQGLENFEAKWRLPAADRAQFMQLARFSPSLQVVRGFPLRIPLKKQFSAFCRWPSCAGKNLVARL